MEIDLNLFSQRSLHIFQSALKFVSHMKHGFIGSEHLLWALSQDAGTAGRVLRRNGMDPDLIKEYLHQYDLDARAAGEFRAVQISQEAEQVIHLAESRAKAQGHPGNALRPRCFFPSRQILKNCAENWEESVFRCRQRRWKEKFRKAMSRKKICWKNTGRMSRRKHGKAATIR